MDYHQPTGRNGLESLLNRFRDAFRVPENLNHYSEKDFRIAEKKYISYCINYGWGRFSPQLKQHSRTIY